MSHWKSKVRRIATVILFGALGSGGLAAKENVVPESLTPLPLTNSEPIRQALSDLTGPLETCRGWLEASEGRAVASVTFVGEDGYFLTKASETPKLESLRLRTSLSGAGKEVREVRREGSLDLVLGQVIQGEEPLHVTAVEWNTEETPALGQWLIAPALVVAGKSVDNRLRWRRASTPRRTGDERSAFTVEKLDWRLGVISAATRRIAGQGAALGIRMANAEPGPVPESPVITGVRVLGVAKDSPAQIAGLRENDVLLSIAGEEVTTFEKVNQLVRKHQPGDEIEVSLLRNGEEMKRQVRLASRSKILANWDGDDFANGGISIRTDEFPKVLQHDLPLVPTDMGGPLLDLKGKAIGINIARADRITTFALPVTVFFDRLQEWLDADRNPPKAEVVD